MLCLQHADQFTIELNPNADKELVITINLVVGRVGALAVPYL